MINFSVDHAFIITYCLVRICGQLWAHRVIETLFLPFVGQCLPNWGDCWEKIFLIHTVILQSSSFTPWYPSKGLETFYSRKHMHVTCSPPGSFVHGILQGRILQWVAMPSSRGSFWPRDHTCLRSPALAGRFFTISATGKPMIYSWPHINAKYFFFPFCWRNKG